MMARRLRRLRNLKIMEVSLVDSPAYHGATVLVFKGRAATLDGIKFAANPAHPWVNIEPVQAGRDISAIATGVVLAAGDPKPDGGKWDREAVDVLFHLWARLFAAKVMYGNPWRHVRSSNGKVNTENRVLAYGMTDKPGLELYAAGGHSLPADAWWIQLLISGETGKKIIADRRQLNGLAVMNAVVLLKADAAPGFHLSHVDGQLIEEVPADVTPEQLGTEIAQAAVEALNEADEGQEVDAGEFGGAVAEAIADTLTDATEVSPEELAKQLVEHLPELLPAVDE